MGIEELKEVVKAGLDIGEALSDGIGIEDVAALLSLPAAITGIGNVPDELEDMDDVEVDELKRYVEDEFDIPNDQVEAFVENAIMVCFQVYRLYLKFKLLKESQDQEEE